MANGHFSFSDPIASHSTDRSGKGVPFGYPSPRPSACGRRVTDLSFQPGERVKTRVGNFVPLQSWGFTLYRCTVTDMHGKVFMITLEGRDEQDVIPKARAAYKRHAVSVGLGARREWNREAEWLESVADVSVTAIAWPLPEYVEYQRQRDVWFAQGGFHTGYFEYVAPNHNPQQENQ